MRGRHLVAKSNGKLVEAKVVQSGEKMRIHHVVHELVEGDGGARGEEDGHEKMLAKKGKSKKKKKKIKQDNKQGSKKVVPCARSRGRNGGS
ncbi:hypothetical protein QG37_01507 [Candidozyma auris]|nr:hypothetical protein QG37_01507 [[Candida] auris]